MPVCYRLAEWSLDDWPARVTIVLTNSSVRDHFTAVVRSSFPGLHLNLIRQNINLELGMEHEFELWGTVPTRGEIVQFFRSSSQLIAVVDGCDMSFCLDMYRVPEEREDSPEEWVYTAVGAQVYQAKYRNIEASNAEVCSSLLATIQQHKGLSSSTAIAAIPPSSDHGSRADCPTSWVRVLSKALSLPIVGVTRSRSAPSQKNFLDREQRRANQENSMAVSGEVSGQHVLVVDDLYMLGDSVTEISRALRAAGAAKILSLCAVKTAKGCQGYSF